MHTQAEKKSRSHLAGPAPFLHAAAGLGLYLLTFAVEVLLGASVRWLLIFLGAATVGLILPLGLSAESLAWIGAAAPLAYSVTSFAMPGRGRHWRRSIGARRPTAGELDEIALALHLMPSHRGIAPADIAILDQPLPAAAVRGRVLIFSRPLVESDSLAPALAHELGHLETLDGRLTEALTRLNLWHDPLAPPPAEGGEKSPPSPDQGDGLLLTSLRWALRLAGGGSGAALLAPAWSAYWRSREYAADRHAASLGLGEDLAQHLADFEQALDFARPRWLFDRADHPPVALRIERLRAVSQ